jgi:hypothetical protein
MLVMFRSQCPGLRITALVGIVLTLAVVGCEGRQWGPLAVIHEGADLVLDSRGGTGPVAIGPECVSLTTQDDVITLVWRDSQTSWDSNLNQIVFRNVTGEPVRVSNGETIDVGGVFAVRGQPVPMELTWISPPAPDCEGDLFVVHTVQRPPDDTAGSGSVAR